MLRKLECNSQYSNQRQERGTKEISLITTTILDKKQLVEEPTKLLVSLPEFRISRTPGIPEIQTGIVVPEARQPFQKEQHSRKHHEIRLDCFNSRCNYRPQDTRNPEEAVPNRSMAK